MSSLRVAVDRALAAGRDRIAAVRQTEPEMGSADALVSRVAWGALVEPGDGVAGGLIGTFGPARALDLVVEALPDRDQQSDSAAQALARTCVAAGVFDGVPDREVDQAMRRALDRWSPRLRTLNTGDVLDRAARIKASLLTPADPGWPRSLDDLGAHAPVVLWQRGNRGLLAAERALAVVGSRANTQYGAEIAAAIAISAAQADRSVVSGGAYGIDAVAHRAALSGDGHTVAVLAGGLDQLYPAGNTALLERVAEHGALVAESPPGTRPSRWRFLARNRLIAALAGTAVVVEAGHRSGALSTAHHAGSLGRRVFAVPGPITAPSSSGCHRLIANGRAEILTRPQEALEPGPEDDVQEPIPTPLQSTSDPELLRVIDALPRHRGLALVDVARASGLGIAETLELLSLAELQGVAQQGSAGWRAVG